VALPWADYLWYPQEVLDLPWADYLRGPDVTLALFGICSAISLSALWGVFRSVREHANGADGKGVRKCAWSKDHLQPHDDAVRWVCTTCGGLLLSKSHKTPVACRMHDSRLRR
jgi:hypothetical protein